MRLSLRKTRRSPSEYISQADVLHKRASQPVVIYPQRRTQVTNDGAEERSSYSATFACATDTEAIAAANDFYGMDANSKSFGKATGAHRLSVGSAR